jgi:cardiolipin synthase
MAVVDRKFTMLGSFNLHYTSFQGNLELNIEVLSEQFSSKVVNTITSSVLDSCIRIEENVFKAKNVSLLSLKRFFFYSLLSVVSNFLLGFIHQEDIDKEEKVSNFFSVLRVFLSFFIFFLGILGLFLPFIPGILFILLSLLILDWTPFRATFD